MSQTTSSARAADLMDDASDALRECERLIRNLLEGDQGMLVTELNAAVRLATACYSLVGVVQEAYPTPKDVRLPSEYRKHVSRSFHDANIDE